MKFFVFLYCSIAMALNPNTGVTIVAKSEPIPIKETSIQKSISGTIKDSNGAPLPGANIIEKDTNNGTQTDFDGNFSLILKNPNAILEISFMGFSTQEIQVNNQTNLSITLVEDAASLDEVVIIGYGTVKKKDLTGSVSSVKAKEAFSAPVASLDQAIQGRAAGVFATSTNGSPGSGATIRIRGGNSITAGNEPLYVIDGFVGGGDLTTINPNDIESIEILKDASSTAIYGARGANGVIIITTKKGKNGKFTLNVKSSNGIQVLPLQIDVQNAREYAEFRNKESPGLFDLDNLGADTNWQDVLSRTANISDTQVSASGGTDKMQFYLSGGYLSQEGIMIGSDFKRYSLRTNIDYNASNVVKIGTNLSLSRSITNNSLGSGMSGVIRADPLRPVYGEDGNYSLYNIGIDNNGGNLLANAELNTNETSLDRILANTYIEAKIAKGLTLRSTFGGDFHHSRQDQFVPSINPSRIISGRLASAQITQYSTTSLLNENTLNYLNTFGNHSIAVLVGATAQKSKTKRTYISANEIPSDGVGVDAVQLAPIEETEITSGYSEFSLGSLLGRINYAYKDKYLFTTSIRRDGSSRLGANNRYAVFPSAAVAWKMSEENFIKNIDAIDDLKLRASYGITGNQGVDPFSTLPTLGTGSTAVLNGVPVTGVQQARLANPDLKWETTGQFDIGFEVSLFKGRLTAELDYYYKKTDDLLLDAEVPFLTGFTTQLQNVGSLENRGFDFNLGVVIIENDDFRWNAALNISTYKNKVLNLGNKQFIITDRLGGASSDITSQLMVGQPVGIFWGAVFEGIDPATGDAIFTDINGPSGTPDGIVDDYDKGVIGSSNPDFFGGFQNNISYKNFDLQAFFQFSVGNENYNRDIFQITDLQLNSYAKPRAGIWTAENPDNATIPGFSSDSFNTSNSFYVQDASFLRLKTLQLGYTFPESVIKDVNQIRISLTGNNLFQLKDKDYFGFDPDVSGFGTNNVLRGYDTLAYPQNRSFLIGLDITF